MSAVEQLTLLDKVLAPFGTNDRYCRIRKGEKGAFEEGFLENLLTFEELKPWLENGGNYGVVAKQGIVLIDLDDAPLADGLPETFTVKTGSGRGLHLYYQSDAVDNGVLEREKNNIGHIQVTRKLVVGPGSIHPNGNMYEILKNVPVAWISKKQLKEHFGSLLRWYNKKEFDSAAGKEFRHCGIELTSLFDLTQLRKRGSEFQGSHPIHGSTTGMNFCVNPEKNAWYCFRHGSGGGPLTWIAVKEGLISCDEATSHALRGDLFKQTLKIAREKYGYKENQEDFPEFSTPDKQGNIRFEHIVFANYLMTRYNFKTTDDDKTIWVYDDLNGIYTPNGEIIIETELTRYLQENFRIRYLPDIIGYIRGKTYFKRPKNPINKIACINGLLNIETKELEPFTPEEFIISRIPVSYAPGLKCLKIEEFLIEVVGDDTPIIQEAIGYCLLQAMPFHVAIMLVGGGANGKSTLINLIKRFLGPENVASLTLQEICTDLPAKANLYGKLANLCADLPAKLLKNTGIFKTLTGNDAISARQLYRPYFNFTNTAKMFFSANKIPPTDDDTNAFFRRWIIIECPNVFVGKKRDPAILSKISTPNELSGLLNWTLEGLYRLLEQGEFSRSKTMEQQRKEYIRKSNTAMAYIEENLELKMDPDAFIEERELYEKYVSWCQKNKCKPTRKAEFTQTLYLTLPGVEQGERRIRGKRIKVYKFVDFATAATAATPYMFVLSESEKNQKNKENKVVGKSTEETLAAEGAEGAEDCAICVRPLPADMNDTTYYNGQLVHVNCFRRLKDKEEAS
jgi:P4 family phage/plasmid primase-like protien